MGGLARVHGDTRESIVTWCSLLKSARAACRIRVQFRAVTTAMTAIRAMSM
jgi:hypothetical protein